MKIPEIGPLSTNHFIGVASIVGILPLKLFVMMRGGASKFFDELEDHFNNQNKKELDPNKHYKLPKRETIQENITHLIKTTMGCDFVVECNGENGLCKIGRFINGFDIRFFDIWES